MNSVTLAAGPWLLQAPVSVLGTIPSVHEDYLTKQGVCLAPAKDAYEHTRRPGNRPIAHEIL